MPRLVEDSLLRQAFRRGEREALATVYREYVGPLYQLIGRGFRFESQGRCYAFKGQDAIWAVEDTVQNVFIRAFAESARLGYDGLRPYRNYLASIAKNLIIDEHRARWRELFVEEIGDTVSPDTEHPWRAQLPSTPEDCLRDVQLQQQVAAFIASLAAADQALFRVRFQQRQSVNATATILKVSEHHVKSREKRLKQRFFESMQRHGYFEGRRLEDPETAALLMLLLVVGGGSCGWG